MSTLTIHVPEEQKAGLLNLLKTIPYIVIEPDQKLTNTSANWRILEGKYAQSSITTQTLAQENEREKIREQKPAL